MFQMGDYEGDLEDLNARARDAEGVSATKPKKEEAPKNIKRLPRFEAKDSTSADGQEQGEEEPEEYDDDEEESAKIPKKRPSRKKKKSSTSEGPDRKDKKNKKDDDEDDGEEDSGEAGSCA